MTKNYIPETEEEANFLAADPEGWRYSKFSRRMTETPTMPNPAEALRDMPRRVQARYDELMREGKHGHYETLFRIVREETSAPLMICRKLVAAHEILTDDPDASDKQQAEEFIASALVDATALGIPGSALATPSPPPDEGEITPAEAAKRDVEAVYAKHGPALVEAFLASRPVPPDVSGVVERLDKLKNLDCLIARDRKDIDETRALLLSLASERDGLREQTVSECIAAIIKLRDDGFFSDEWKGTLNCAIEAIRARSLTSKAST